MSDPAMKAVGCPFVPVIPALQVKLVSLDVLGITFGKRLFLLPGQSQAYLPGHILRNIFLHRKKIGELAIVLLAPEVAVVPSIHQLAADQKTVTAPGDATREH